MMSKFSADQITKKHKYYNNTFFAQWATLYDYEKYVLFPLRKKAAHYLRLAPPKKIIDVATGTGAQALELAKIGHDVIGIDLSEEMLAQAKKKLSDDLTLQFQHADATDLPFTANRFDAASISLGLHDMPYEVDIKALKEVRRVVKKNGTILIVDYNEPQNHWIAKLTHPLIGLYETKNYNPFIKNGLKNLLKKVNLKVERETNFLGIIQIATMKNSK